MKFRNFCWPAVNGEGRSPQWTGRNFLCDNREVRVLSYNETESAWSDSLTCLHEESAGRDHPIDLASRRLAIASMRLTRPSLDLTLIDVGCSSGYMLEDLHGTFPSAGIIGSDYIRPPLERLAERLPSIPLLQFDLRTCPLPEACVDGITCLNVLEHIDDDVSALRHLHRILKPGGVLHLEVPAGPDLYDIYDEQLMHHRRYKLSELSRLAQKIGFVIERATHLGFFVYLGFAAIKKRQKKLLSLSAEEKKRRTVEHIKSTNQSRILAGLFRMETKLGKYVRYPFGIRAILVARKAVNL